MISNQNKAQTLTVKVKKRRCHQQKTLFQLFSIYNKSMNVLLFFVVLFVINVCLYVTATEVTSITSISTAAFNRNLKAPFQKRTVPNSRRRIRNYFGHYNRLNSITNANANDLAFISSTRSLNRYCCQNRKDTASNQQEILRQKQNHYSKYKLHSTTESTMLLTNDEIERYSRHLVLNEFGIDGQIRLKNSKILVIGAGGLGSSCLLYLAAAGVGTIGIVDSDIVDVSNLQRQIIHSTHTVNTSKCTSAQQRLLSINPTISIIPYEIEFTSQTCISILTNSTTTGSSKPVWDLIIDGSDNFPTKYLINDVCEMYNIPWIYSAILGFEGQVSVFNYNYYCTKSNTYSIGPTYRDLLPIPPNPGDVPSCAEGGVLGILPGTMGCIQATEAIKLLLYSNTKDKHPDDSNGSNHNNNSIRLVQAADSKVNILSGRVLVYDALKMRFSEIHIQRDVNRQPITSLIDYQGFCSGRPQVQVQSQSSFLSASAPPVDVSKDSLLLPVVSSSSSSTGQQPPQQQRTMDEDIDNSGTDTSSTSTNSATYNTIEPFDCYNRLVHDGWAPYVIDVRLQTEHEIVALPFTDIVIGHRTFLEINQKEQQQLYNNIPDNCDILIYCKGGVRGKKACQGLIDNTNINPQRLYNLNGGILQWQNDIDPTMPRY